MQSGPKLGPKPNSLALWTLYWEQCICIQMLASFPDLACLSLAVQNSRRKSGRDVCCGRYHMMNEPRPSARISYCKQRTGKAWEQGYTRLYRRLVRDIVGRLARTI